MLLHGDHHQRKGGAVQQELGEHWVGGGTVGSQDVAKLGMLRCAVAGDVDHSRPCDGQGRTCP